MKVRVDVSCETEFEATSSAAEDSVGSAGASEASSNKGRVARDVVEEKSVAESKVEGGGGRGKGVKRKNLRLQKTATAKLRLPEPADIIDPPLKADELLLALSQRTSADLQRKYQSIDASEQFTHAITDHLLEYRRLSSVLVKNSRERKFAGRLTKV
ncbi:unnamed protein product [Mesocestoides corti]|uniref:Uncharacterized protein n=1 Tax=Mesocestoides corti TaxID=53468 RepID=A0A0R3UBA4_MESCO|nr:unnamed protein product [Mesocestoides corti]